MKSDRWNLICPTEYGLRAPRELMLDGPRVAVEAAIGWAAKNKVDVWATMRVARGVQRFPEALEVWAPEPARFVWAKAGVPFDALCGAVERPLIPGPKGIPRPANALFLALEKICTELGGKEIRVFGARWHNRARRWQWYALRDCYQKGTDHGVAITIMPT